ncbi:ornithine carbamoyltransferase, partial [Clostridioides difficile]
MYNISLKGKSFLTVKDFTKEEIRLLLTLSCNLKTKKKVG